LGFDSVRTFEAQMENIDELHRQATDAISSRLWTNTVAIVNSIRAVGIDPVAKRPADGEEAGTGCAGRWGSHHFILTAVGASHPTHRAMLQRTLYPTFLGISQLRS
jgi:hypothetical protein